MMLTDGQMILMAALGLNPARIEVDQRTGCWLWLGGTSGTGRGGGYAKMSVLGCSVYAHVEVYTRFKGKRLRKGLQHDHECVTRRCICPYHLHGRTQSVNLKLAHRRRKAA